ncbi:MAG: BMP family ABC transporter substrate-binding protein, partial [Anaerovoracaceae bacterium]
MKRILAVLLVVILALSIGACTSKQNQVIEEKPLIVLVTDVGGLGDQSIHDVAWAGCEKAESKYDIEIRCLESESADEYVKNVELAVNDGATLTICVGENFTETIKTMGEKYPKNNFLLLDGVVDLPNVSSVVFKGEEGGFLAGVVAAEKSQTKKVGFVGG